jgi:hypothetical protein
MVAEGIVFVTGGLLYDARTPLGTDGKTDQIPATASATHSPVRSPGTGTCLHQPKRGTQEGMRIARDALTRLPDAFFLLDLAGLELLIELLPYFSTSESASYSIS